MYTFLVAFRSFEDVREFVSLALTQPYDITVSNGSHAVDAKSLMVMFSLDYSRPLEVRLDCTAEDFAAFAERAAKFRVS